MKRKDREIKAFDEMVSIVSRSKVCHMAMSDGLRPYVIAMNYGYEVKDGKLVLYFHSAKEGQKMDFLRKNARVCIAIDCSHGLLADPIACKNGFLFESVVGEGDVVFLSEMEEKNHALCAIMEHQAGWRPEFNQAALNVVAIFQVTLESMTGKKRLM